MEERLILPGVVASENCAGAGRQQEKLESVTMARPTF